jgi:DNA (cytosine-5)-methyltransferase 3A
MKVLSLFDGMGCARLALQRANIPVEKYYTSEVDKYASAVCRHNFPDVIELGDINNIDFSQLKDIDLVIGGSPCTDLSIAKKGRQGLKGEQSKLFFKFVEALNIIKPKYYILENVNSMSKENKRIISDILNSNSVMINSALLSAQSRKRLYWTNSFFEIPQPKDRNIYLRDILVDGYTLDKKSYPITATYSFACAKNYFLKNQRQLIFKKPIRIGIIDNRDCQGYRVYSIDGKSIALSAQSGGRGASTGLYLIKDYVRKLYPVECEKLQTVPHNFTQYGNFNGAIKQISDTQRYKMLGNGFTVDVISHILKEVVNNVSNRI